jgi:hypothetical protein
LFIGDEIAHVFGTNLVVVKFQKTHFLRPDGSTDEFIDIAFILRIKK